MASGKPRLAVVLGDPAGIGPELVARLLAEPGVREAADLLLIADRNELEQGMQVAGLRTPYAVAQSAQSADFTAGLPVLVDYRGGTTGPFVRAQASAQGGRYCLDTLSRALEATRQGHADAILFAPLNKTSLHEAGMHTSDELHWLAEQMAFTGPVCEFNVLDGLWTSRVTSHIALKDVAQRITFDAVTDGIELIHRELLRSGIERPRIAVCGLNPHNGDNGSFGREEIDVIGPAVQAAGQRGLTVEGPFPADTIFLKVQGDQRQYDAVVTMYHDQGQIAMKLMGFSRGITVQGGLPVPILTPAHGTAFDIVGKGVANPGAMLAAFRLACRMATARR
ncbi:4-hydroxythreonine-4-phosphate dehydrogenase PdxA [Ramlibacter henchirensis]|uniref:4-hydroxythreonine-4-phosphate dehydrogenase PdxA n=1 Tax=Ramlibacter henchirensis TaxID=204072 RepID=A0A4Z0BV07_9BURK|nr:4-hydroxythreonine-4-phosphate dehydrogenase PdxA [Ramlibacter henchirensis]TFZ02671.1 4-hydroxythreonine-4-phosphate dehydrogenase PdxA [Ramlibacter henchirensis]